MYKKETYHSKSNVCFLKSRSIVGTIARHSYNLAILGNFTVNDTFDEGVFISGRRASQNAQLGPNLIKQVLLDVAVGVTDSSVKFLTIDDKVIHAGRQDATLYGD